MPKIKNEYNCALVLTFDLLGGKWKLRILWHIMQGDNRFSLLLKAIPDITEKVLTTQLRELEESGLVVREIIKQKPLNVQYELSDEYAQLEEIIEKLCDFSKQYGVTRDIIVHE